MPPHSNPAAAALCCRLRWGPRRPLLVQDPDRSQCRVELLGVKFIGRHQTEWPLLRQVTVRLLGLSMSWSGYLGNPRRPVRIFLHAGEICPAPIIFGVGEDPRAHGGRKVLLSGPAIILSQFRHSNKEVGFALVVSRRVGRFQQLCLAQIDPRRSGNSSRSAC